MSAAPAWITYATGVVAVVALIVSLATYRRAGPIVRASVKIFSLPSGDRPGDDLALALTVGNRGLASIDILAMHYGATSAFGVQVFVAEFTNADVYDGPALPFRLDGNAARTWILSVRETLRRASSASAPMKVEPRIRLRPSVLREFAYLPSLSVAIDLGNSNEVIARLGYWKSKHAARLLNQRSSS
jgi:hypothetical protein